MSASDITYFNYSYEYTISCISSFSRPSVLLQLYDAQNQKFLQDYNSNTVKNAVFSSNCDNTSICSATVTLQIVFNDPNLLSTRQIQCIAKNTTSPYDILVVESRNINVTNYISKKIEL